MARLYSGSSRPYPGRPVCHAGRSFPGEITGRGYRYPNVPAFPGKGFRLERRYEPKESRQGRDLSSAMQGNLCDDRTGVSRGHKPNAWGNTQDMVKGRTCVSREEPSGLDMAMKPTGRANSVGA